MKEPIRFFNFQMPYKTFQQLELLSKQNECSIGEIVRQAINLLLEKINTTKERKK